MLNINSEGYFSYEEDGFGPIEYISKTQSNESFRISKPDVKWKTYTRRG